LVQSDQLANARAKPQLALRVGVTGARNLDQARLPDLHEKVRAALTRIGDEMNALAREPDVVSHYAGDDRAACKPFLRLISPLALGADRLVADEALRLGYKLYVPMPFSRAEYEQDFTGTNPEKMPHALPMTAAEDLAEFHALLEKAGSDWMSLDGDYDKTQGAHEEQRNRAYEAVGRFVVRNSDIVIAIWNGEGASGRGGTAQIVEYAASVGVPVWWINAAVAAEPLWISDIEDARDPASSSKAAERIHTYLRQQVLAPKPVMRKHQKGITGLARLGQSETVDPALDYFDEVPRPVAVIWQIYKQMMLFASSYRASSWTLPAKPKTDAGIYWFDLYQPSDARANEYAARYRSSYVWIFALTAVSLLFGGLANIFHGHHPALVLLFASLELSVLGAVLGVAILALRHDWHERSIEYRLLAELCRKQQVLAPLGRALSFGAVRRLAAQIQEAENVGPVGAIVDPARPEKESDRAGWVSWLFMAYQRGAPPPRGEISAVLSRVLNVDLLQELVDEQLEYHAGRVLTSAGAAEYFEKVGGAILLAVLFIVAVKILLTIPAVLYGHLDFDAWVDPFTALLGLLGVVLPAWSAAAVGIGSYAEWQALAEESNHMLNLLTLAKKRIQRVNLKRPLASQDLGAEADAVASTMLQDLEGWQRLFRVKMIDPT
jgi:hypothetical protein